MPILDSAPFHLEALSRVSNRNQLTQKSKLLELKISYYSMPKCIDTQD